MSTTSFEHFPVSRVAKIYLGGTPSRSVQEYWGNGIKWASAADVAACDTRYIRRTTEQITDLGLRRSAAKLLGKDTIVITARGTVGALCMLPEPMSFNQTSYGLVCKDGLDPTFLYFALKARVAHIASQTYGAVFSTITMHSFDNITVPLLPLPIQRKIAAILSAYDDLIENNTRRIKILEEMAQAIYREWFVNFRFPDHEKVKMVESELGLIPDGWEVKSFTQVIDVLSGGTPKTSVPDYWGGTIPWFTPRDLEDSFYVHSTARTITNLGLSKCNSKLYPAETVFITARGTVGKCVLAAVPMAMSQTSYALRGHEGIPQAFVYLLTRNMVEVLKKNATGAVFDTVVVDTFRKQNIVVPPPSLLLQFADLMAPVFSLLKSLQSKNTILRRTRDLLLPKLISGELDMSGLDIKTEGLRNV